MGKIRTRKRLYEVESSNIESLGFLETYTNEGKVGTTELVAKLKGNRYYTYSSVPPKVFSELIKSESIGSAFSKLVRGGGYQYHEITEAQFSAKIKV
jgi:hypothetical protein